MLKKLSYALLCVLGAFLAYAQEHPKEITLKVDSRTDGSTIPFVVVQLLPKPDGFPDFWITDEKGTISLPVIAPKGVDSIRFSSIGFQTVSMSYLNAISQPEKKITLNIAPLILDEAIIYAQDALIELGNHSKPEKEVAILRDKNQVLIYVKNSTSLTGNIQAVKIYLDDFYDKGLPFRLRMYSNRDTLNNIIKPGDDLLDDKVVLVFPKKRNGWHKVDVSTYAINFPNDGIFVGVEGLDRSYYPEKEVTLTRRTKDGKKRKSHEVKVPSIGLIKNEDFTDSTKFWYTTSGIIKHRYPMIRIVVKKNNKLFL